MADLSPTEDFDVSVEKQDAGWVVIGTADGERKQIGEAHPSKEEAETYAKHMGDAADRFTGAAQVAEPGPAKYPGDGDPSRNWAPADPPPDPGVRPRRGWSARPPGTRRTSRAASSSRTCRRWSSAPRR